MKKYIKSDSSHWADEVLRTFTTPERAVHEIEKNIKEGCYLDDVIRVINELCFVTSLITYDDYTYLWDLAKKECKKDKRAELKPTSQGDAYIDSIVSQHQPKDTKYIFFGYSQEARNGNVDLTLTADGSEEVGYLDDVELIDEKAIDKLERWAKAVAKHLKRDKKYLELAASLESQTTWDWYSGMSLEGSGGPFTYSGFELCASSEE